MLQQTRVDTVIPYYLRWMRRFPSLRSLATASPDDVLKLWEGLGYYGRARNAHAAARIVVDDLGGRFPRTLDGLRDLPGIGPYTAAAIGSLATGVNAAVVDANVMRVLSRLYDYHEPVTSPAARRQVAAWAHTHLVPGHAGRVNEATMELGALVCTPGEPNCPACPMAPVCRAHKAGTAATLPVKKPAKPVPHREVTAGLIVNRRNEFLVTKRRSNALLGGLWEFPGGTREPGESLEACLARELHEELAIRVRVGPRLLTVDHAFSHFTMALHAIWARIERGRPHCKASDAYRWLPRKKLSDLAFPRADQKIIEVLMITEVPEF